MPGGGDHQGIVLMLGQIETDRNSIPGRGFDYLHLGTMQKQGEMWQRLRRLCSHRALDFLQYLTAY